MYNKQQKVKKLRLAFLRYGSCALIGGGGFALLTFLVKQYPDSFIVLSIAIALMTMCACALVLTLFEKRRRKDEAGKISGPMLGTIMYDSVNNAREPALICDCKNKIIWYNRFSLEAVGVSSLLGAKLSSVIELEDTGDSEDKKFPTEAVLDGKNYLIESTKIRSNGNIYYFLKFRDVTEIVDLKQFITDEDNAVAYIIIDNLEELMQFEQESYRESASRVEEILREWAQSVNGILKEYERDKYLFFFKNKDLQKFVSEKFEILDRVREIRVGMGNIPITLSIGVGKVKGSLSDRERAAHSALDLALQRGGDQAVVKYENKIEYYGGLTNSLQKRTKVFTRVASTEILAHIASASNVIIMAHKYPDYDAFGASVGMARLAMYCGVKVNIVTDFKNINIKKCLKIIGDSKLYKGLFVDSASGLDLVSSDTLLVLVDVNNPLMFESRDIYDNVYNVAIIDHHRKTSEYPREPIFELVEPSASSASELVSEMLDFTLQESLLAPVEANMLLAGITLDTRNFTKGAGTKTFAAAMYLRDNGASYDAIQDLFKSNISEYKQEALFGQKIEIYRHCMAIAVNESGVDATDKILASRVADNLLMVDEVMASFALVQIGDSVHISARSNGTVNVQLILEALQGGGRYDAAGAVVRSAMHQVLLQLKEAIDNYLDPEER
ncbi:MAG: DHH family phosphoesterase [Clostridia bacterium]|nr:DHH family phosphoesterase [Clostridia bacterium]